MSESAFTARLRALTSLDKGGLGAIASTFEGTRQLRSRAELVAADVRRAERIHILLDGWACRMRLRADGRRQITALLIPGDVCDLAALHARHCGSAVATLSECRIASVDAVRLRAVVTARPRVAAKLG